MGVLNIKWCKIFNITYSIYTNSLKLYNDYKEKKHIFNKAHKKFQNEDYVNLKDSINKLLNIVFDQQHQINLLIKKYTDKEKKLSELIKITKKYSNYWGFKKSPDYIKVIHNKENSINILKKLNNLSKDYGKLSNNISKLLNI
jgi:hypothetical protein